MKLWYLFENVEQSFIYCYRYYCKNCCRDTMTQRFREMSPDYLHGRFRTIPEPIEHLKKKGDAGRVCIVGGSRYYTGAPYFVASAAMKSGVDLVYNLCAREASVPLKSYDPNLMVAPFLDLDFGEFRAEFDRFRQRFNLLVLGPGLGRDCSLFPNLRYIIECCRERKLPLIIDADGLYFFSKHIELFANYPGRIVFTPNVNERKFFLSEIDELDDLLRKVSIGGSSAAVLLKNEIDKIYVKLPAIELDADTKQPDDQFVLVRCATKSGLKRCGGQGDFLVGVLSAFLSNANVSLDLACYAAAFVTRQSSSAAFEHQSRSMLVTDMLTVLPTVLKQFIF